jgi:GT2 family glycosyltransferase
MFKTLKLIRDLIIIKKSKIFDANYYLTQYPDVRVADCDPLHHFVKHGWKENRNPSADFNTSFYLSAYRDVKVANINPLVHYIRFGRKEGRRTDGEFGLTDFDSALNEKTDSNQTISSISKNATKHSMTRSISKEEYLFDFEQIYKKATPLPCTEKTDIIICVGKSPANILACLPTIREHTAKGTYTIHLVTHIQDFDNIKHLESEDIKIHTHEMPIFNFSRANNIVLKDAVNDVVLLNDDTEVSEGWLEKLRTASKGFALTGAHTLPHRSGNPDMWGHGETMVTNWPINMFCAYIPMRLKEIVGILDEEFFYYGGEDVDYSIRARLNGIPLVISDAFIEHKDNQSFGEAKMALMAESDKVLFSNYGAITPFDLSSYHPLVSIIIATYKRGHLIDAALDSIYQSNYKNFEVIVVDDCSPDETFEQLVELQKKYPSMKILRLEKNQGAASARAAGLALAKGQFAFFTDDDDTVLPNRISGPLDFIAKHLDLDVVYCDYHLFDGKSLTTVKCAPYNRQKYLDLEFFIGLGVLFARTTPLRSIPFYSYYNHSGDYDWVFRFERAGYKIDYCPEVVMNYNRTGEAGSHLAGTQLAFERHTEVYNREVLLDSAMRR